jgi:hypothetical protein
MKRVTITLEFEESDSEYISKHSGGVDIGLLLRDALGEFEAVRTPANEYVAKRYPGIENFASNSVAFKIRDVEKRNAMAHTLCRADVTIHVEDK